MKLPKKPDGVVALITVLVVMVTLVSIGVTISAVANDEVVLGGVVEDGEVAFAIADGCVEEGLTRLKAEAGYAGGSFPLGDGTCALAVTVLGADTRLVRGQGSYGNAIRIIDAYVTIRSNAVGEAKKIRIDSWKEAD